MNTTGELGNELCQDVIHLDQQFFPRPWTAEQWSTLDLTVHKVFSWTANSIIEGFALFGSVPGDDTAHLYKILIHPDLRGHGVAQNFWTAICKKLIEEGMKSIYLEVEASNNSAIRFYKKNGFKELRRNRAYYSNGEDALVMHLTL